MHVKIRSFSFYFEQDLDLLNQGYKIIDCRNLPDPEGLKVGSSGKEEAVQNWIVRNSWEKDSKDNAITIIADAIGYIKREKITNIAFGCVAGKNRSVAMAELLGTNINLVNEYGKVKGIEKEIITYNIEHLNLSHWI